MLTTSELFSTKKKEKYFFRKRDLYITFSSTVWILFFLVRSNLSRPSICWHTYFLHPRSVDWFFHPHIYSSPSDIWSSRAWRKITFPKTLLCGKTFWSWNSRDFQIWENIFFAKLNLFCIIFLMDFANNVEMMEWM